jgi:hypothetical protein
MSIFAIYDSQGNISGILSIPEEFIDTQPLEPGQAYLKVEGENVEPYDKVDVVNKKILKQPKPEEPKSYAPPEEPEYYKLRKMTYPSVQEQLDMLYDAMKSGEIPKATKWFNTITAIKENIPKNGNLPDSVYVINVDPIPD